MIEVGTQTPKKRKQVWQHKEILLSARKQLSKVLNRCCCVIVGTMTIILGIDPGSRVTGYGVIRAESQRLHYIDSGCVVTDTATLADRLVQVHQGISQLVEKYSPQQAAIEQVFMKRFVDAALKLGHARGVAMVAVASAAIPIAEYSPRQIKQAVVGYGAADKVQVQDMVKRLLGLVKTPQSDAADALAVAICHANTTQSQTYYDKARNRHIAEKKTAAVMSL